MIIEKKKMCVEKWFKDLLILQYVGSNFNLIINNWKKIILLLLLIKQCIGISTTVWKS